MLKVIFKIILIIILACAAIVALVEVYPEQMRELEEKTGLSIVDTIQTSIEEIKEKIHDSTSLEQQRKIEEIVNDEITQ